MTDWDRRIARAEELEREMPAAAELLRFYRTIAEFQKQGTRATRPALMKLLEARAPEALAQAAREDAELATTFADRVLAQTNSAEAQPPENRRAGECPRCGELPVCAALRREGDGGKRWLVCARCFAEWEFNRIRCPYCGEEDKEKLPVYTAGQFPYIRVETCDVCKRYLKAIDLTRNGLAVPEVDDIASVVLDLWAEQQGYLKIRENVLGL
jgi:formate dehydrogenase maturation protein FdhE